ncbi:MAG: DUF4870 domain-containing protein [Gammaproteobacteria bacterium]|jgi:uncharacterized Tic20 family protein|nr:DUF4870 domain-containing protein [Gammaproteobacteria bacterium]
MSVDAPTPDPGGDPGPANKDARTFGMLCHLLGFAGFIIPFGSIIGPLVMWLLKRDEHPFVDDQGKEAVNFQISMLIYFIVAAILTIIVIGVPILIALGIFWLVIIIVAAVQANTGVRYRYPLNLRLIK